VNILDRKQRCQTILLWLSIFDVIEAHLACRPRQQVNGVTEPLAKRGHVLRAAQLQRDSIIERNDQRRCMFLSCTRDLVVLQTEAWQLIIHGQCVETQLQRYFHLHVPAAFELRGQAVCITQQPICTRCLSRTERLTYLDRPPQADHLDMDATSPIPFDSADHWHVQCDVDDILGDSM
jgi:hypothetical protein